MATEESPRGTPEEHDEALEGLRRFFWGVVGMVIAFVLWIRFQRSFYQVEPEWLAKGVGRGLLLGAYFGMASWRGRRERLAGGVRIFAGVFIVMIVLHAIWGLLTS